MEQHVLDAIRTELTPEQYQQALDRLSDLRTLRLLHVSMGLATEAGEFADILKRWIFYGKPIDDTHVIEELGDTSWYERVGCHVMETAFNDMLQRNVAKLKARYPDKFNEDKALNRNLELERKALNYQTSSGGGASGSWNNSQFNEEKALNRDLILERKALKE